VFGKTTDVLRDPRSLQITNLFTFDDDTKAVGCMEFRSRNGFGGFTDGYSAWALDGKTLHFSSNSPETWNRWCVTKHSKLQYQDQNDLIPKLETQSAKS
jgi:hypothetical protein